eukprot:Phypoly_transcript_02397.p1 GENE.Phypoly_transcript_02397~~Phypoly_transcript_02397.p1  ORF type:complete len:819 (-),score=91.14 Phypoly_transcript_02397:47-2503(-)
MAQEEIMIHKRKYLNKRYKLHLHSLVFANMMNTSQCILSFLLILGAFISTSDAAERAVSNGVSRGWELASFRKRESLGEHEIKVLVALSQRNLHQLESEFWDVSDPRSNSYGRYKSFHEVVNMVSPSQSSIDQVTSYFKEKGIHSSKIELHSSRDFMSVSMTLAQAEDIFQTVYEPYVHSKSDRVAVGMSKSYNLDDKIDGHIDFISGFSSISVARTALVERQDRATRNVPRAPFAASSAPYIRYLYSGYTEVDVRVILLCPDGSAPTISGNSTVGSTIGCGAVNITHASLAAVSRVTNNTLFNELVDISTLTVYTCSDFNDTCAQVAQAYNFSTGAAYVPIVINNTGISTYVPYTVKVFVVYSDNTTSNTTESSEAEEADIASPNFLHTLYSVKTSPVVKSPNNNQSVVQFEGQSYNTGDLQKFFALYNIPDYSNLVQVVHPENNDPSNPGDEASLDIQSIMGIAQNCTTIFWANNNTGSTTDDHLSWITEVLNQPTSPLVFSLSYGNSEGLDYNASYVQRTNYEFMKAGLRGITIVYSAGDDGAFNAGGSNGALDPSFPASSPYITSVGGTQLYSRTNSTCFKGDTYTCTPEEVVSSIVNGALITGGGGFSNLFPRPSYQDAIVVKYLPLLQGFTGFNSSNRVYPDISTIAHNAPEFINGGFEIGDGTSASAPYFAGLVTLLNDLRLQYGNAPLGFLNPFIYSLNTSAFTDVVRGNNNCSSLLCFPVGYNALPGFDAASGRGTPIFDQWAAAVLALPPTNSTTPTPAPTSTSTSSTSSSSTTNATTSHTTTATSGASRISVVGTMFGFLIVLICIM